MRGKGRAGALVALAIVFFIPAVVRMANLVESGAARAVDLATIFAAGFVCGALLLGALPRWRAT